MGRTADRKGANAMRTRIGARAAVIVAALALGAGGFLGGGTAAAANPTGFTVIHSAVAAVCQLEQVDLTTGALTAFGPADAGHCVYDLAVGPGGTALYGVTFSGDFGDGPPPKGGTATAQLIRYDITTGAATTVGTIGSFTLNGPDTSQGSLTFDNAGNLFVHLVPNLPASTTACDFQSFCLYRVNATTPSNATPIGPAPFTFTPYFGLAASCGGSVLSIHLSGDPASFGADTTSTTTAGTTGTPAPSQGRTWDSTHAASTSPVTLASVNTSTGTTTDIGTGMGTNNVVQSLLVDPSAWSLVSALW